VPVTAPRRRAGWPKELSAAVDLALAAGAERPPHGIRQADWERVLDARRQEAVLTLEELRHLGPVLTPEQVLLTIDAVLTRTQQAHQFGEIRTARITTVEGTRCLSGTGDAFLQTRRVLTLLSMGPGRSLLLLADGARWIRAFWRTLVVPFPTTMMILDWWHLRQKCAEFGSRICRGHLAKERFLRQMQRRLWRGDVDAACAYLEAYRPQARNTEKLEELLAYLRARQDFLPNYRQRYIARRYIGSGHTEKLNDLLIARRQKGAGRHGSQETSDALAAGNTARSSPCSPVDPDLMRANLIDEPVRRSACPAPSPRTSDGPAAITCPSDQRVDAQPVVTLTCLWHRDVERQGQKSSLCCHGSWPRRRGRCGGQSPP